MDPVYLRVLDFLEAYSGAFTVLIALVAAVWALIQLKRANTIRKHEFEDIYVQRYWQIMDQLTADQKIALIGGGEAAVELTADKKAREVLWQYLELCEDEADLRAQGLITKKTWKMWRGGVHSAANRPPYKLILEEVLHGFNTDDVASMPFERLREAKGTEDYDPRRGWLFKKLSRR